MKPRIRIQLSVMMFLQYFIWGAWYVTLGTYLSNLGFQGIAIGSAYSTTALAAMISPFFVGMIADRFFATEKVLGFLHLAGALLLYGAARLTDPDAFFWVLLLHTICYMPTLALTNAVSFHQIKDSGQDFPAIRVLGTIGWIAAGWLIGSLKIEATALPLKIAAAAGLVMGLYCFTLPSVPRRDDGRRVTAREVLGWDALKMMKEPSFAIFIVSSLLICIPLSFYYAFMNMFLNEVGVENAAGKMTFGQVSEIVFMLVMPFFFARLGVKKMLLAGMIAWVARFVLFAFGNSSSLVAMFYAGILLHGICYDFFFVTGQIYVDKRCPASVRANAQGFLAFITLGLGMFIGAKIGGWVVQRYQTIGAAGGEALGHDWRTIWLIPAAMAAAVAVIFALLFRERDTTQSATAANSSARAIPTNKAA